MKISVITATYNAIQYLPTLVESLRGQTDKDFEWVVADGASTDGTLEYLKSITDLNVKVISQEDFGIYDALNRGIKACSGEFYLVVGADDVLYHNAIEIFRSGIGVEIDIVTASIDFGDRISKPRRRMPWFYGQFSFVSGHAVGSLFRKSLHDVYGYYSKRFPIAADQYFILKYDRFKSNSNNSGLSNRTIQIENFFSAVDKDLTILLLGDYKCHDRPDKRCSEHGHITSSPVGPAYMGGVLLLSIQALTHLALLMLLLNKRFIFSALAMSLLLLQRPYFSLFGYIFLIYVPIFYMMRLKSNRMTSMLGVQYRLKD